MKKILSKVLIFTAGGLCGGYGVSFVLKPKKFSYGENVSMSAHRDPTQVIEELFIERKRALNNAVNEAVRAAQGPVRSAMQPFFDHIRKRERAIILGDMRKLIKEKHNLFLESLLNSNNKKEYIERVQGFDWGGQECCMCVSPTRVGYFLTLIPKSALLDLRSDTEYPAAMTIAHSGSLFDKKAFFLSASQAKNLIKKCRLLADTPANRRMMRAQYVRIDFPRDEIQ